VAGGGSNDPNRLTQPTYGAAITSLTSTLSTDVNEKSALIGVNTSNGNGQLEARINPAGTSGNTGIVNVNQPNYIATGQIHTHTSVAYPTPSAGRAVAF
jgi:hypothetical protein